MYGQCLCLRQHGCSFCTNTFSRNGAPAYPGWGSICGWTVANDCGGGLKRSFVLPCEGSFMLTLGLLFLLGLPYRLWRCRPWFQLSRDMCIDPICKTFTDCFECSCDWRGMQSSLYRSPMWESSKLASFMGIRLCLGVCLSEDCGQDMPYHKAVIWIWSLNALQVFVGHVAVRCCEVMTTRWWSLRASSE